MRAEIEIGMDDTVVPHGKHAKGGGPVSIDEFSCILFGQIGKLADKRSLRRGARTKAPVVSHGEIYSEIAASTKSWRTRFNPASAIGSTTSEGLTPNTASLVRYGSPAMNKCVTSR
jgi:hypothetical protein